MNLGIASFLANLVSLCCAGIAGYMAINDIHGWGWFLFGAMVTSSSVKIGSKSKKD